MPHQSNLDLIYKTSFATFTDLYQLTMGAGYFHESTHEDEAVFHMFFRNGPFSGPSNFAITAGLAYVIDYLKSLRFTSSDIVYLKTLKGADGKSLFSSEYLEYLYKMKFSCSVDAIPEGTVVFPHEPLIRVRGPIIQCQLIETALLNIVNFQTLIATKAARVCYAANNDKVAEFGLRRAQGIDGGLSASRACYIGGCSSTSNVLAGKLFGIPVTGTHAHSWVMSFDSEEAAFSAYAASQPNNCVFLVDTYNTVNGVKTAIKVGLELGKKGFKLNGIRLDSGDIALLSAQARKMLDKAGLTDTKIIASNDLDEEKITQLKWEGARVDVWGVGTCMVTAYDQPALGGVYKLGAIKKNGKWVDKIKISSDQVKMTNPGILDVLRSKKGDMIVNHRCSPADPAEYTSLLVPIFNNGTRVYNSPPLNVIRDLAKSQLDIQGLFDGTYKVNLHYDLLVQKDKMVKNHENQ